MIFHDSLSDYRIRLENLSKATGSQLMYSKAEVVKTPMGDGTDSVGKKDIGRGT